MKDTNLRKIAHDLSSPLGALRRIFESIELPEAKASLFRESIERLHQIREGLISGSLPSNSNFAPKDQSSNTVLQLMNEKVLPSLQLKFADQRMTFETDWMGEATISQRLKISSEAFLKSVDQLMEAAAQLHGYRGEYLFRFESIGDVVEIKLISETNFASRRLQVQNLPAGVGLRLSDNFPFEVSLYFEVLGEEPGDACEIIDQLSVSPDDVIVLVDDDELVHQTMRLKFPNFFTAANGEKSISIRSFNEFENHMQAKKSSAKSFVYLLDHNLKGSQWDRSPSGFHLLGYLDPMDRVFIFTNAMNEAEVSALCQKHKLNMLNKDISKLSIQENS